MKRIYPFTEKQKTSASIALCKRRDMFEKEDIPNHFIYSSIYN